MNQWILIGHRGVGKTQLLQRLKSYSLLDSFLFFDLDEEIEKKFNTPLVQLFPSLGESQFRQIEKELFLEIQKNNRNFILSVGAGFSLEVIPEICKIIWVRRNTDFLGRIFLNRPRLNPDCPALEEFHERYDHRQKSYVSAADDVYWMPEGIDRAHPIEEKIWTQQSQLKTDGILTLLPTHIQKQSQTGSDKKAFYLRYDCDFFEIRDDLIPINHFFWKQISYQKRLFSFRSPSNSQSHLKYLTDCALSDWALELGPVPTVEISILSSHAYLPNENLSQFLRRLEQHAKKNQHLKASPIIENFSEAIELLRWQQEDPENRSILPRSQDFEHGRWLWLRLYLKGQQKINFWRDSDGSAWDQPTLFEWLSTSNHRDGFAALFGNPVFHSQTMFEHSYFFTQKNLPIWPILLLDNEFESAITFLIENGLRAAAVTSPFKKNAFSMAAKKTLVATELETVNTFKVIEINQEKIICGHNTDLFGFAEQMQLASTILNISVDKLTAVVWGGGGTLPIIRKIVPQAIELSVRTKSPRKKEASLPQSVDVLIWAAGPQEPFPPKIEFNLLVDLNYREDSQGREWALQLNKRYVSGQTMFKSQALAQRLYWQSHHISS